MISKLAIVILILLTIFSCSQCISYASNKEDWMVNVMKISNKTIINVFDNNGKTIIRTLEVTNWSTIYVLPDKTLTYKDVE